MAPGWCRLIRYNDGPSAAVCVCAASSTGKRSGSPRAIPHFGGHAVDPGMAPRGGVARHVVAVNEPEIELGFRVQLQRMERCGKAIVSARLGHRQVEEIVSLRKSTGPGS